MRKALLLLALAVVISTIGFMIIESASLLDSFFMTIVTLSTVGYREVFPLSDAGKVFSSIMILANMGVLAYALSAFSEYIIEGQFLKQRNLKRMEDRVQKLSNHIIICGYSKYSEESILQFAAHNQDVLLIDRDEEKIKEYLQRHPDGMYIEADASDDHILEQAQISKAKALICAMADRSENIFITLTTRQLNPTIKIIARTADDRTEEKLRKAGADHVIMPERMGGFYMATVVNKPGTVEFFDRLTNEWESEVHIEEITYQGIQPRLKDLSLGDMQIYEKTGANIIGFRDPAGKYIINPAMDLQLITGSSLIALGTPQQIEALVKYCG